MRIIERFPAMLAAGAGPPRAGSRNLRLWVFSIVFVIVATVGLVYTYSRPPEYRAGARLEIIPAERPPSDAPGLTAPDDFLTETQFLTGRQALGEVFERMRRAKAKDLPSGPDPVTSLQQMISVSPMPGTHVAQLWAVGSKPELVAFALNELMAIYDVRLGERFVSSSKEALAQAREEVAKYDASVLKKRGELEDFRIRHGIVSQERDENERLARAKGLADALNAAEEKAVTTQTRLRSLKASVAQGKAPVRSKDDPVLAAMQQQLSKAREELKQLESQYTWTYLAREPRAVALRTQIPELEAQVKRQREASQQDNLAEAEQEAAQAQDALDRLRSQLAGEKQSIQTFSSRFGEYEALQDQLTNLETLRGVAADRLAKIEAREGARKPQVRILDAATVPTEPWRPNYTRDAGISLSAALVLGFLAAWLTDFLVRRETGPMVIVAPTSMTYPFTVPELMPSSAPVLGTTRAAAQLPSPQPVLRELEDTEITALLDAADDESRLALVALLSGVDPEELLELTWRDVDFETNAIRISHPTPRELSMAPEVAGLFTVMKERKPAESRDRLLSDPTGHPAPLGHLEALISYAAHDAGLERPAEVTPAVIRHTFVAFLVRQGIRFSELVRIVGPLPAGVTAAYGAIVPTTTRRSLDQSDRVIPALRELARTLGGSTSEG